eukprot:308365-Amphidinium_carterae.1
MRACLACASVCARAMGSTCFSCLASQRICPGESRKGAELRNCILDGVVDGCDDLLRWCLAVGMREGMERGNGGVGMCRLGWTACDGPRRSWAPMKCEPAESCTGQ